MPISESDWPEVLKELETLSGKSVGKTNADKLLARAREFDLFTVSRNLRELASGLEEFLDGLLQGGAKAAPPARRQYVTPDSVLTAAERKREEVFGWLVGVRAAELPAVRAFRARYLGPDLLARSAALALLTSAPHGLLTISELGRAGVPLLGLSGTKFTREAAEPTQESDGQPPAASRWSLGPARYGVRCQWTVDGEPRALEVVPDVTLDEAEFTDLPELRWQAGAGGGWGESAYRSGTAIQELADISQFLAKRTWWAPELVPWFVLTGEVPASPAIRTSIEQATDAETPARQIRIVVSAQPWVSMESVQRAYQDAQQWALGRGKHELSAELLERFRFVEEFLRANPRASWPEVERAFAERPEATESDARVNPKVLRAGYRRVREDLLLPDLAMGASAADLEFARAVSERYRADELREMWASAPGRETAKGAEEEDAGAPEARRKRVRKSAGRTRRKAGP